MTGTIGKARHGRRGASGLRSPAVLVTAIVKEMRRDSERASVILGAAGIDKLLLETLRAHLRPVGSGRDSLLEGEGPLSTFSARIQAAYRLGIIDENFEYALDLIRKIRNGFAHGLHGQKLAVSPHRERILELMKCFRAHPKLLNETRDRIGPSDVFFRDFLAATGLLMLQLETELPRIRGIDVTGERPLAPRDFSPSAKPSHNRSGSSRKADRRRHD